MRSVELIEANSSAGCFSDRRECRSMMSLQETRPYQG